MSAELDTAAGQIDLHHDFSRSIDIATYQTKSTDFHHVSPSATICRFHYAVPGWVTRRYELPIISRSMTVSPAQIAMQSFTGCI